MMTSRNQAEARDWSVRVARYWPDTQRELSPLWTSAGVVNGPPAPKDRQHENIRNTFAGRSCKCGTDMAIFKDDAGTLSLNTSSGVVRTMCLHSVGQRSQTSSTLLHNGLRFYSGGQRAVVVCFAAPRRSDANWVCVGLVRMSTLVWNRLAPAC